MSTPATRTRAAQLTPHADSIDLAGTSEAPSRRQLLVGRVLSGLAIAFLLLDAGMKVLQAKPAIDSTVQLGYPAGVVFGIGVAELICLVLYAVPRTAVLGAILLTAHLGGAVATQVRMGNPLFTHVLFPTYVAAVLWAGLYLREPRLRALLPFRR